MCLRKLSLRNGFMTALTKLGNLAQPRQFFQKLHNGYADMRRIRNPLNRFKHVSRGCFNVALDLVVASRLQRSQSMKQFPLLWKQSGPEGQGGAFRKCLRPLPVAFFAS